MPKLRRESHAESCCRRNRDLLRDLRKRPPLFLVPGLGGVGNYWAHQIKTFSEHFTVIVHDHRGTGQSTRSEIFYSVDEMTKDLLGLMDALGINKAHLVGHSTGGAIGQTMAIEHSDRIDRLVLYATWTKCDPYMRRIFEIRKTLLLDSGVEAYIKATPIFLYPDWWINQNADAFEKADRDLSRAFLLRKSRPAGAMQS